jgi:hypothetical protein
LVKFGGGRSIYDQQLDQSSIFPFLHHYFAAEYYRSRRTPPKDLRIEAFIDGRLAASPLAPAIKETYAFFFRHILQACSYVKLVIAVVRSQSYEWGFLFLFFLSFFWGWGGGGGKAMDTIGTPFIRLRCFRDTNSIPIEDTDAAARQAYIEILSRSIFLIFKN